MNVTVNAAVFLYFCSNCSFFFKLIQKSILGIFQNRFLLELLIAIEWKISFNCANFLLTTVSFPFSHIANILRMNFMLLKKMMKLKTLNILKQTNINKSLKSMIWSERNIFTIDDWIKNSNTMISLNNETKDKSTTTEIKEEKVMLKYKKSQNIKTYL